MPKNKKKWIDKKNAVTFHLVHRSQQDPLAADETAPQRVLLAAPSTQGKLKKNKEEETKYGIYFDDDYDYLQHLRETGTSVAHWEQIPGKLVPEKPAKENNIKLPSSVFASEVQEDVGLLNRAAPRSGLCLDLDPDVVAAMDEDFDFDDPENQLEDDFILKANASGDDCFDEDEEYEDISDDESSSSRMGGRSSEGEMDDDLASLDREDTKSRFTEFSMSSSVVPRNDQLTLLDDRFEKMFAEYDENEIGALDCEEIEGEINPADDMVLRLAEEEFDKRSKVPDPESRNVMLSDSGSDSSLEDDRLVPVEEKEKWDCESILSTYSNLYNHPKLITEPKVNKIRVNNRTGMPVADNQLTARNLARLEDVGEGRGGPGSVLSALSTLSIRNKDETPEEKRQRKADLKQYRRDRRVERKLNTNAFKEEKKRQERHMINSKVSAVAVHL